MICSFPKIQYSRTGYPGNILFEFNFPCAELQKFRPLVAVKFATNITAVILTCLRPPAAAAMPLFRSPPYSTHLSNQEENVNPQAASSKLLDVSDCKFADPNNFRAKLGSDGTLMMETRAAPTAAANAAAKVKVPRCHPSPPPHHADD